MSQLKPCPFCGCEGFETSPFLKGFTDLTWVVRCGNPDCNAEVVVATAFSENAVERWNRRRSPWQPIETAPTDGTVVLVLCGDLASRDFSDTVFLVYYNEHWCDNTDALPLYTEPTHWMPLPEPPK